MKGPTPRRPLTTIKTLPTRLTPEERNDRGRTLALRLAHKLKVQADAKTVAAEYKEQLKEVETEILELQDAVNNSVERRQVECEIQLEGNLAHVIRKDTGDIVETRPATKKELASLQTTIYDMGAG